MKIRAIRAAEVGPFSGAVALEGLSGGLDVLTGPNEIGKSTLFAALATLLAEKHTSTARTVAALRPDSGGAPLIEADLEIDGRIWRLRKRFLTQRAAELTDLASGEISRGGDAEERIVKLLGSSDALRGFVWVPQGASFDLPDLRSDKSMPGLIAGLSGLVEQEAANAAGAGIPRRVGAEIAKRLGELVTAAHGKAKAGSALDLAQRRRNEIASQLDTARARAQAAEARLQRLTTLRDERNLAANPAIQQAIADRVAQTRKAVLEADQARDRLRNASERINTRQLADDQARSALEGLDRLIAERDRTRALVNLDSDALAELSQRRARDEANIAALRAEHDAAASSLAESRRMLALAHAAELRKAAVAELAELDRRLAAATDAAGAIAAADQRLAANAAREPIVEDARRHASRLAALEAKVASGAPRASITYVPGAAARIRIAGRALEDGEQLIFEQPTELVIDGIGTIRIEPPESEGASAAAARDACRAELMRVLASIGAADIHAAHALLAARRQDESARAVARAELAASAPRGLDALTVERTQACARVSGTESAALPDRAEMDLRTRALEADLTLRQAALVAANDNARRAADEIVRLEARLAAAQQRCEEIDAGLPPAADRNAARKALADAVDAKSTALAEAVRERTAWAEATPDGPAYDALVALARQATAESAKFEQARSTRERELSELEGALRRDGEDGVGAEIAGLEEELEVAAARVADLELEVRALDMLRVRIERIGADHRDQVLRPVVERLQRLLDDLLPGARLTLDGPLLVASLQRAGRTDTMARLSGGTREQIATLVRIAYADLMAARGIPLPLVLDDALVFSDDDRLSAMLALLAAAARRHQVIVLSCRSRALEPILAMHDVHRLEIGPWPEFERLGSGAKTQKGRTSSPASALAS